MSRWFRFYDDAVNDPKVQRLAPELFKAWINILCIVSKAGGTVPPISEVAFALRVKVGKVQIYITELVTAGLLDKNETGFAPHNWNARQFKSDVSNERVKQHRERKCNVTPTVTVTPPETEQIQNTETEQSREKRARRATRLPNEWIPDENNHAFAVGKGLSVKQIENEALKFLNYWTSKSGQGATKTDWSKTWQNWILTATQGVPTNGRRTVHDAANDLIDKIRSFDEPAPSGLLGSESEDVVRLLPARRRE
jgi:hypothetical protein